MMMIGIVATGIGMFIAGAALVTSNRPLSEKETIEKAHEKLELARKKEKMTPIQNADINLFGLLKY